MALNNLASAYTSQGRLAEARPLLQRGIAIGERVWGPEHPSYGVIIHSLGELETADGELDQAERLLAQALGIYELQRGFEYLGLVLYQLAQVSARQVKHEQALDFLGRALEEGYEYEGGPDGFRDDPALLSLRDSPRFDALAAAARARAGGQ